MGKNRECREAPCDNRVILCRAVGDDNAVWTEKGGILQRPGFLNDRKVINGRWMEPHGIPTSHLAA
jgi:hypothetical protein